MTAEKTLHALSIVSSREMKDAARAVLEKQVVGTQTLVVLNTVERAKAMYDALAKLRTKAALAKLLLVHSRFRPAEREQLNRELQEKGAAAADRIIVATQVVEAGVDISARTLITELAPWASIVQRVGHAIAPAVNRTTGRGWSTGSTFQATTRRLVRTVPMISRSPVSSCRSLKAKTFRRVRSTRSRKSRRLRCRSSTSMSFVDVICSTCSTRRRICPAMTSISNASSAVTIQKLMCRCFGGKSQQTAHLMKNPGPTARTLQRTNRGCPRFPCIAQQENREAAFAWDHLEEKWMKIDPQRVRPGMVILLRTSSGGYSELGWDPASSSDVETVVLAEGMPEQMREEAAGSDIRSELPVPYSIAEHTQHVCDELAALLKEVRHVTDFSQELTQAARWHDTGKALLVCQQAMHDSEKPDPTRLLAKSGRTGKLDYGKYGRKHFRHELGSALAVLQQCKGWPFLIAYLIAAHHGRVRLSIRALPGKILRMIQVFLRARRAGSRCAAGSRSRQWREVPGDHPRPDPDATWR